MSDTLHSLSGLSPSSPPSPPPSLMPDWSSLAYFAVSGVNHSLQGNGGQDCMDYLPSWQRWLETLVILPGLVYLLILLNLYPSRIDATPPVQPHSSSLRQTILLVYSLCFGAEMAFKMISRTAIFLLNPCHVATTMQLLLLTMDPTDWKTTVLFRIMIYFIPGASIALAFPILNTRFLPGEVAVYYVQHIAIILVPLYLLYIRGAYDPERTEDLSWAFTSYMFNVFYHFVPLQWMSIVTHVNLNNIMCPAISDPFASRLYRIIATSHQALLVPLLGKLYLIVARFFVDSLTSVEEPVSKTE